MASEEGGTLMPETSEGQTAQGLEAKGRLYFEVGRV